RDGGIDRGTRLVDHRCKADCLAPVRSPRLRAGVHDLVVPSLLIIGYGPALTRPLGGYLGHKAPGRFHAPSISAFTAMSASGVSTSTSAASPLTGTSTTASG